MPLTALESGVLAIQLGLLLAIGLQFRNRLHSGSDFVLGRRRVSMPLSAASLALNSVPLWWLIVLVAAAFAMGVAAIWLALALLGGIVGGGWYLAPRLRALTNLQQRGTFAELLAGDAGARMRTLLVRSTVTIIAVALLIACIAQMQLAARLLGPVLELSPAAVMVGIGCALGFSLLLAGVWTTATVDVWQLVVVVVVAVIAAFGLSFAAVHSTAPDAVILRGDWFADHPGLLKLSFTLGIAFVAGDVVGQAPLLARYMACSSDAELARARVYSLLWAVVAVSLSLWIGWATRALSGNSALTYSVFTDILGDALTPQLASVLMLLVIGAAIAAIGNSLQAAAAHIANDTKSGGIPLSLARCRLALLLVVVIAVVIAINLPQVSAQKNFDRLLFCWHALGAAFAPLLIVRLSGKRVRAGSSLGSMWSGFLLTVVFYLMPDTPGELLERGLPFAAALGIALSGGERRRNPDRADRGERTVHDRLPI